MPSFAVLLSKEIWNLTIVTATTEVKAAVSSLDYWTHVSGFPLSLSGQQMVLLNYTADHAIPPLQAPSTPSPFHLRVNASPLPPARPPTGWALAQTTADVVCFCWSCCPVWHTVSVPLSQPALTTVFKTTLLFFFQ